MVYYKSLVYNKLHSMAMTCRKKKETNYGLVKLSGGGKQADDCYKSPWKPETKATMNWVRKASYWVQKLFSRFGQLQSIVHRTQWQGLSDKGNCISNSSLMLECEERAFLCVEHVFFISFYSFTPLYLALFAFYLFKLFMPLPPNCTFFKLIYAVPFYSFFSLSSLPWLSF